MSAPITIRMTLTGPFEGKTKLLNRHQFIDGVCDFTGSEEAIKGVTTYFTRSYQVEISDPAESDQISIELKAVVTDHALANDEVDNDAVKEDDSILGEEIVEEEDEDAIEEPNARQASIIAAVNNIDKDKWIDLKADTPHPRIKDVAEATDDPTITKAEVIEVIETWLS